MFTGIVTEQGKITQISKQKGYLSLRIKTSEKFRKGLIRGASVSVNGACLTFKKRVGENIEFDVVEETLGLTNLRVLKTGSMVNLERSMKASSEIGGHLVSGHIQGIGIVTKIDELSNKVRDIKIKLSKIFYHHTFNQKYDTTNSSRALI